MYNNEVTYAKEFDTEENKRAYKELEAKYFDRSYCAPSCPIGWAPEVLDLLERIDKELGIERNTSTIRGYYVEGTPFEWFLKEPITNFFSSLKEMITGDESVRNYYPTFRSKVLRLVKDTTMPILYGNKAIRVKYINNLINNLKKPKFRLDQVKEKYGELNIHYACPDHFKDWVDKEIRKTIIKLSQKGCYYPLESLYNYATIEYVSDTDSVDRDIVEVIEYTNYKNEPAKKIRKTTYRSLMSEMGINMKDIAIKAMVLEGSKKGMP